MIAHVCACTGWTWDYVESSIDLPRLGALTAYWRSAPPLHLMVRDYLGFGKKTSDGVAQAEASGDMGVDRLPKHEFEQMLTNLGLPVNLP